MSVLTMPTYDFSSIPKHLVCKQAPSISYCKASTPGVSRGRCGNTQLRGTGPVPQHEGSGASSATAAGTGRGGVHMLGSSCHFHALQGMGGSRSFTGSNESLPALQLPAG